MFKWLKEKFGKKEEPEQQEEIHGFPIIVTDTNSLCSVTFSADATGVVNVGINAARTDIQELGLILGQLLFEITSGKLNKSLNEILEKKVEADPVSLEFIVTTQEYWKLLVEEQAGLNDAPLISPLVVFQNGPLPEGQ